MAREVQRELEKNDALKPLDAPPSMDMKVVLKLDRGGSAVGSTHRFGAQGPGFEPGHFHDAHDVPVLCQLAV